MLEKQKELRAGQVLHNHDLTTYTRWVDDAGWDRKKRVTHNDTASLRSVANNGNLRLCGRSDATGKFACTGVDEDLFIRLYVLRNHDF